MNRIVRLARNKCFTSTPTYVVLFVTSRCNARCRMCFNWRNVENAEHMIDLTLEEYQKIFSRFGGIQQLTLSGGEPFLRPDLPSLLGYVSDQNKAQMITIPTNGIQTEHIVAQTKAILSKMSSSTHLRVALSLQAIGEGHDAIVKVEGAFGSLCRTYDALVGLDHPALSVDISLCCSGFNKQGMKATMDFCRERFIDANISLVLARGDTPEDLARDVGREEYREIVNHHRKVMAATASRKPLSSPINAVGRVVSDQVVSLMQGTVGETDGEEPPAAISRGCHCTRSMIVIQSDGQVYPCESMNKPLGSLKDHDYDIKRILALPPNRELSRFIAQGGCSCTWECSLSNNLVSTPSQYPKILRELLRS